MHRTESIRKNNGPIHCKLKEQDTSTLPTFDRFTWLMGNAGGTSSAGYSANSIAISRRELLLVDIIG
jgi:hypothetical protein